VRSSSVNPGPEPVDSGRLFSRGYRAHGERRPLRNNVYTFVSNGALGYTTSKKIKLPAKWKQRLENLPSPLFAKEGILSLCKREGVKKLK